MTFLAAVSPMAPTLSTLAFIDIGSGEIVLVLLLIMVLFGGDKLPELARGLGKSIREFRKATAGLEQELKRAMEEEPKKPNVPVPIPHPALTASDQSANIPPPPVPSHDFAPPEDLRPLDQRSLPPAPSGSAASPIAPSSDLKSQIPNPKSGGEASESPAVAPATPPPAAQPPTPSA